MRSNFAVLWKFKTYLDKRWVGGSKMFLFMLRVKNVHVELCRWSKRSKCCPPSCWMPFVRDCFFDNLSSLMLKLTFILQGEDFFEFWICLNFSDWFRPHPICQMVTNRQPRCPHLPPGMNLGIPGSLPSPMQILSYYRHNQQAVIKQAKSLTKTTTNAQRLQQQQTTI